MTKLLYLEDWDQLNGSAKVIEITTYKDKPALVLDQTIFYPQGGGQPWDMGTLTGPSGSFAVNEVRFDAGTVYHIGTMTGAIEAGATVQLTVDAARRKLHCRLHSGGHLLDMAVKALRLQWIPGKGYHFPEGPYIEYAGSLDGLDKEKIKVDLEAQCAKLIAANTATSIRFMPDKLVNGKPARMVLYGDFELACGGTHVNALGELRQVTVRKIKQEGSNVRVAYDVAR